VYTRRLHTEAGDIWAVGLVYFSIVEGRSGFAYNPPDTLQKRIKDLALTQHRPETSEISRDFIRQIIVRDPKQRATIDALLNHRAVTNELLSEVSNKSNSQRLTNNNKMKSPSVYFTPEKMDVELFQGGSAKRYRDSPMLPRKRQDNPNLPLYIIKFIDNQTYIGLGYLISNGDCGVWKAGGFQALELARDRSLEIRYRGERWTKIPDWYLRDNPNCLDHSIDELKTLRIKMEKLQNGVTCLLGRVSMHSSVHLVHTKRLGNKAIIFYFSNGNYQVNFFSPSMKLVGCKDGICLVDHQRQKYFLSWDKLNDLGRIVIDTDKAIDQEVYLANQEYAHKELLIHRKQAGRNGGGHDCIALNCRLLDKIVLL